MIKKLTGILVICLLYGAKCFAQAPVINYKTQVVLVAQTPMTPILPVNSGGAVVTYAATKLPDGLRIDGGTGVITGTPTAISGSTSYTVTATNASGTASFNIFFTVNPQLPNISYAATFNVFNIGATITPIFSVNSGGVVDKYAINPALPAGLIFDANTGAISGTSTTVNVLTNYTITATNVTGSSNFNLQITIQPGKPYIAYPASVNTFIVGITNPEPAIPLTVKAQKACDNAYHVINNVAPAMAPALTPDVGIVPISYSISPSLPAGLYLNTANGSIHGTPTAVSPIADYKITATYANFPPSTCDVNIAVVPDPGIATAPGTITFVGQGNIQPSFSSGAALPASTGIGVIFEQSSSVRYKFLHDIRIELSINIASTVDTIKSSNLKPIAKQDYGNSVLTPLNSGQAFSFNFTGYFTKNSGDNNWFRNRAPEEPLDILSGMNISFVGSNRNWAYDSTYTDNNSKSVTKTSSFKASLLSLYVGIFHEFIPYDKRPNNSITLGVGYSGRFIAGDIAEPSQSYYKNQFLGSKNNVYHGAEIVLGLRFSNIKAEVHVPFLGGGKNNVPGLSGAQPNTLIAFSGGFPIDLGTK